FHRILTSAFQTAVWVLLGRPGQPDLARELPVARRLVASLRQVNFMPQFLANAGSLPDAAFADAFLQPVEHSYTVESLERLARSCGLEMLTFCNDVFSRTRGEEDWNLELEDPELRRFYGALNDTERWQVANLL